MNKLSTWVTGFALIISASALSAQEGTKSEPVATEATAAEQASTNEVLSGSIEDFAPMDLFSRDTYRIDSIVCPFKGSIDYEPGEIECGLLEVPENRESPGSRFIELHFVKLNSRWGREDVDGGKSEKKDSDEKAGRPRLCG